MLSLLAVVVLYGPGNRDISVSHSRPEPRLQVNADDRSDRLDRIHANQEKARLTKPKPAVLVKKEKLALIGKD